MQKAVGYRMFLAIQAVFGLTESTCCGIVKSVMIVGRRTFWSAFFEGKSPGFSDGIKKNLHSHT